jgi:hypothetical protein
MTIKEGAAVTLAKAIQTLGVNTNLGITSETVLGLYAELSGASKMSEVPGVYKATYNQSGSATSGLTAYDLEAGSKLLYPVLTPLRNLIPRVSGKGGIQANWRAITGVNTTMISAGVSEGNRGGTPVVTTADYLAAYKGIGYESSATFEAQYAGEGFDDIRMRAAQAGLHSLMLAEEKLLLGGNGSLALGTTPTPSLTASTTGGTLATATYSVIAIALTQDGYPRSSVAGGLQPTYVRTNADGSSDTINGGVAQKSTNATIGVTGATGSATASVTAVRGAQAYAWFWGPAGSEVLGAITTVPKLTITATATGTQLASALAAADRSADTLVFDGLITQALKPGSGAYWKDLGGATLTAAGNGKITEIEVVLQYMWDNYRLNPDTMWVSSQQSGDITSKVLSTNGSNAAMRYELVSSNGVFGGGSQVVSYMNSYGLNGFTTVAIKQHPNLTPGTILFTMSTLPYPMSDVSNVFQVRTRQDYYQVEWPLRSRKYEYGIYADEVLQHFAPFSMAVLTGIAPG